MINYSLYYILYKYILVPTLGILSPPVSYNAQSNCDLYTTKRMQSVLFGLITYSNTFIV